MLLQGDHFEKHRSDANNKEHVESIRRYVKRINPLNHDLQKILNPDELQEFENAPGNVYFFRDDNKNPKIPVFESSADETLYWNGQYWIWPDPENM